MTIKVRDQLVCQLQSAPVWSSSALGSFIKKTHLPFSRSSPRSMMSSQRQVRPEFSSSTAKEAHSHLQLGRRSDHLVQAYFAISNFSFDLVNSPNNIFLSSNCNLASLHWQRWVPRMLQKFLRQAESLLQRPTAPPHLHNQLWSRAQSASCLVDTQIKARRFEAPLFKGGWRFNNRELPQTSRFHSLRLFTLSLRTSRQMQQKFMQLDVEMLRQSR